MGWGRNPPPPPGAAPVDANGNPFENEHQAKCYAESAAKREARQAKRDARAQPPPSTEFAPADLFSDARPCALLMVQDRSKARKLATLLNDAVSSAAYLPGLAHAGAVVAPVRENEKVSAKDGSSCRDVAWVALRHATSGALKEALAASPEDLLPKILLTRALAGECRVSTTADEPAAIAALVAKLAARGTAPLRVAVRCFPRALERQVAANLPTWCALEPRKFDVAVHAFCHEALGTHIGIVDRTDEWTQAEKMTGDVLCRAAWKMKEALANRADRFVVDVGAAPGGWTAALAERGVRVVACDPAALRDDVASHPLVTHARCKIEDLDMEAVAPGAVLAGVVCDINAHPAQASEIIAPLLRRLRPGALVVVTLKFGGRGLGAASETRKARGADELVRDIGEMVPLAKARVAWLVANTDRERTLIATVGEA